MNDDDELDAVLGLKRGESVPHERHGEMGVLYRPVVQLSQDEWLLYGEVWVAWGDHDLGGRDNVVKLVERVALETVADQEQRAAMIKNVVAYIDELAMIDAQGSA